MQALVDQQLGRELSQYEPDLVRAVQGFAVMEMSIAQERMIDEFARCWCDSDCTDKGLCYYHVEDNYKTDNR